MAKKEKKEKTVIQIPAVITITGKGAWYSVEEHFPEIGKLVVAYSSVYRSYCFAQYNPVRGWRNQDNTNGFSVITHWLDMDFPLPFPIMEGCDEDEAKRYGLKNDGYGRYV